MGTDTPAQPGDGPALLVDARTAARMLAVSPRTLHTLTRRGELPSVRVGRLVRYSPSALAEWIQSRQKGGAA